MPENEYGEILHSSLVRPQLILGCDRDLLIALIFLSVFIGGILGIFQGNAIFTLVGVIFWLVGHRILVKMGKTDPYMRQILVKSITQYPLYPAVAYASDKTGYTDVRGNLIGTSCAGLLPYAGLIEDAVVLLKDGGLLCCFEYSGMDLTTATDDEKANISRQVTIALNALDENFTLQFDAVRIPSPAYPEGSFSEIVTYCIDKERKNFHEMQGTHFENRLLCFMKWKPAKTDKIIKTATGAAKFFRKKTKTTQEEGIITDEQINRFIAQVDNFISSFKTSFDVEILLNEELLNAIALCVTGKHIEHPMPEVPWALDTLLAADIENGDPFMFGDEFVKVIALDGFPPETIPSMLMWLAQLPFEYRWNTRWKPMDYQQAYAEMSEEQRKWQAKSKPIGAQLTGMDTAAVDNDALEQVADVNDAVSALQRGGVSFGRMTTTIIVRDKDYSVVESKARDVVRVLQECIFTARIEKRNTLEAFMGAMPGNSESNCRQPRVKSTNLAHLLMLSSAWPGLRSNPCSFYEANSPSLMQTTSDGGNPFRLNIHVGDVGHTLVIGPTGTGKSVLLAEIAAQFDRYRNSVGPAQVFVFDKGRSMFPLISAMQNASYYELGADPDDRTEGIETPMLCPLSSLETAADRTWAVNYIETLVQLGGGQVTPARRKEINKTITEMATGTKSSQERSLYYLHVNIQDEELENTLQPYTINGPFGTYLDGVETNIKYSRYTCFEIEQLMQLGENITIPVLLYLFHEIEKRLDGRPSLIILDEAWVALKNPLFSQKISEWLRVLRKSNCAVILATQSLSEVMESEISAEIFESCKTRIMLANPEAGSEAMKEFYIRRLQFTEAETDAIAKAIPKREYFYASPYGKRKFNLNLGPLQLAFVGASGKEDLRTVEEYKSKYGKEWPVEYLAQKRNLPEWADYMRALFNKYKK